MDAHLADRSWLVGEHATIADLGLFPYTSVAGDAGVELTDYPHVCAWLDRVRALPGFADDFITYPDNARPEVAQSIY
jgi:glutathione S-transferase